MRISKKINNENCKHSKNSYFIIEQKEGDKRFFGIMISNQKYEDCIEGLFEDLKSAEKFAEILYKNDVSPIHLAEVTDDYIGKISLI